MNRSLPRTRQNASPTCDNAYAISAQAEAEEHSLEKRSLGGFCEQRIQPFEELCPRMKPRGRD
jgi:hypothetical protein